MDMGCLKAKDSILPKGEICVKTLRKKNKARLLALFIL